MAKLKTYEALSNALYAAYVRSDETGVSAQVAVILSGALHDRYFVVKSGTIPADVRYRLVAEISTTGVR